MSDYITLGSTPYAEDCAQVGRDDYFERTRKECRAYIGQLERLYPKLEGCFRVKSFPHDSGTYHEIVVYYGDPYCTMYEALEVERNLPEYWDEAAKKVLS